MLCCKVKARKIICAINQVMKWRIHDKFLSVLLKKTFAKIARILTVLFIMHNMYLKTIKCYFFAYSNCCMIVSARGLITSQWCSYLQLFLVTESTNFCHCWPDLLTMRQLVVESVHSLSLYLSPVIDDCHHKIMIFITFNTAFLTIISVYDASVS